MKLINSIENDNPNLWIKLADSQGERIPVHREALYVHSACVRDLPDGDTWDLSSFIVEGGCVKRSAVISWLEVVYHAAEDERQQTDVGLHDLLAFADAVGSSKRIMLACCKRYASPVKPIALPQRKRRIDGTEGDEPAGEIILVDIQPGHLNCLYESQLHRTFWSGNELHQEVVADLTAQQEKDLIQQLAKQLETLLFQAYHLDLPGLQQQLHKLLSSNSLYGDSLLTRQTLDDLVFSARVLQALGITPSHMQQQVKQAWIDSLLLQPIGTVGPDALLDDVDGDAVDANMPDIDATLKRDLLGVPSATSMRFRVGIGHGQSSMSVVHRRMNHVGAGFLVPLRLVVLPDAHSAAIGQYPPCL